MTTPDKPLDDVKRHGLPTLHIIGDSLPQAYYRAISAVWKNGLATRTQYDRKDDAGNYIDPPGKDATVLLEILDPFDQPRFPPISFCEIGPYILELLGVKDFKVPPLSLIRRFVDGAPMTEEEDEIAKRWPYTYHQRLTAYPAGDQIFFNQIDEAIRAVAQTPYTRRAMSTTAVPNLDPKLTEDIPCLREIQLRCFEEDGILWLNPCLFWRSRDLYKAWGDNVIAITFWLQLIAAEIGALANREVRVGSYKEVIASLHIYGQDFSKVGGDAEKGLSGFFDAFPTEEAFIARSLSSEMARDMTILDQMKDLKSSRNMEQWGFTAKETGLIDEVVLMIESGVFSV
jgi:thymidylate synthase